MKAGWRRVAIRDVCRVVSGTTPDTSVEKYWNGNISWITPSDLGALTGRVISTTERAITEAAQVAHRLELLPLNSVVISSRAPIGHLAITSVAASLNQGCKGFVCNGQVDSNFLYHALRAHKSRLQALGSGATFAEVSKSMLEQYEIDIPSIEEQRLVAERLDRQSQEFVIACEAAADQVVSATRLLSSALRESFANGVPVSHSSSISALPAMIRHWRWHRLLDLARLESGHTPSRRRLDWWGGDVPWLALTDIRKLHGKLAYETIENTNDAGLKNSSARLLPVGTVCLSRTASVGFATILGKPMATSQDFCNWICGLDLDPEFLMYAFMAAQEYLRELGSGAVHKTIYMPTIKLFHVCAPDIAEQRCIARALSERLVAAESLTAGLETRLAEIERLPQQLLTAVFGQAG